MSEKKIELVFVKYEFTPAEMMEIAGEMARHHQERKATDDERKSAASQFKATIDVHDAQLNVLSENYRSGYVYRNLECHVEFDFIEKVRRYIRPDTGEIVKIEPLKEEDYQTSLYDEFAKLNKVAPKDEIELTPAEKPEDEDCQETLAGAFGKIDETITKDYDHRKEEYSKLTPAEQDEYSKISSTEQVEPLPPEDEAELEF